MIFLIQLFHHRWNIPILSEFSRCKGGLRFIVLANNLAVSRDSLRTSLNALIELGLVAKNPGYGHPLRPEYVLTDLGRVIAPLADNLFGKYDDLPILAKKWAAPTIESIYVGNHRFSEIRSSLSATPRALTQSLRELDDSKVVTRVVDDGYPPKPLYELSSVGNRVAKQINRIGSIAVL